MPKKLVRLPGVNNRNELIDPDAVAAITSCNDERCIVMLYGHSEEGGYHVLLPQESCANALGFEIVDSL